MDLAGNLLWEWTQVWRLLDQFPRLQKLSVAANRLGDYHSNGSMKNDLVPMGKSNSTWHCDT